MHKINIVNELHKVKDLKIQENEAEANEILESVKQNLINEDKNNLHMLTYFGTSEVIKEAKGRVKRIERIKSNNFLSKDDIKKVCWKYNLRFLNSKYYKKEVPMRVLNDLTKYKAKLDSSNTYSRYGNREMDFKERLFIIAPPSHFHLGDRPVKDPVLLYEVNKGEYEIISTWGDDFNWSRRLLGILFSFPNLFLFLIIIGLLDYYINIKSTTFTVVFAALGIIHIIATAIAAQEDDYSGIIPSIRDIWDKPFKS